jgi:phosphoserine aminotransferase
MTQLEEFAIRSNRAPGATERAVSAKSDQRQRTEQALHDIDLALVGQPQSLDLQSLRARTLLSLGRDLEARTAYLGILQRNPDHLEALTNLGRNLATNGFRMEARVLLERAVARYPGDAVSHVNLGTLLYQGDEPIAARALYQKALQLEPTNAMAHAGMSFVLSKLGDNECAAHHRRLGFAGRSVIALPYRGEGAPVSVLLLGSTYNGNVPLERFLDDRTFQTWVVSPEFHDLKVPLPPHQLIINAIGDVDAAPGALRSAQSLIALSSAPVINTPNRIAATGRCANWRRLAHIPNVITPRAKLLTRAALHGPNVEATLQDCGLGFPLLLRSPGFHTGEHFVRVQSRADLLSALNHLPGPDLIAIEFLDTRGADRKTRKYRVMMIDGELYPLHLAIANDWKVHYFSADMADKPEHREEEERFLRDMTGVLGERGLETLRHIQHRLGLDYGGIDFALGSDREIVVFEANATMAVYPPERAPRWDYRRAAVERIDAAVRRMLLGNARQAAAPVEPQPQPRRAPLAPRPVLSNELNFSAGPGALPAQVLQQAQQAIVALPETGLSVLGMSHRSAWFADLLSEAEANLRQLLAIPQTHAVLFLQGGSSLQFSMIPMNFASIDGPAPRHVCSGYWSAKAIEEARCVRPLELAWDGRPDGFRRLPTPAELTTTAAAPYLHYVSNETVEGLQFPQTPDLPGVALIADMSSDFLSRPIAFAQHAMVYAHAQKNLGPAGVTVCVIDRSLLERVPQGLPPMLDYRTHLRHHSNYNTPPVFGIYVLTLVTRWVRDVIGGLEPMTRINRTKASQLYGALDRLAEVLVPHADLRFRSAMNVSFRFRAERLNALFLEQAAGAGFAGLAGHRALGGIRASLYNAVTVPAVEQLCDFLTHFAAEHG